MAVTKKKPRTRLYGVVTKEVSFVTKGAIRRPFILAKRDEEAPLPEALAEVVKVGPPQAPAPPAQDATAGAPLATATPNQSYQVDDSAPPKKMIKVPKGAKEPMAKAMKMGLEKYADLADMVYGAQETEDPYEAMPPQDLIELCNEIGEHIASFLKSYPGLQIAYTQPTHQPTASEQDAAKPDPVQEALHMSKNETPVTDAGAEDTAARFAALEKVMEQFDGLLTSLLPAPIPAAAPTLAAAPAVDIDAVIAQAVNVALGKAKEEFSQQTAQLAQQAQQIAQQNAALQKQIDTLKANVPSGRIASQQPVNDLLTAFKPSSSSDPRADVRGDLNSHFASQSAANRRQ